MIYYVVNSQSRNYNDNYITQNIFPGIDTVYET